MTELRVMTYNVRSLRDSRRDVVRVIRDADPDVLCVQEAPRFLWWRWQCRRLAAECGMAIVTGGRPAAAMLLLVRPGLRVLDRRDVRLPKRRGLHQRGLAIGVLDIGGTAITVASTHWSRDATERVTQLPLIRGLVERAGYPVVLAGDLNEGPDQPAWQALCTSYQDAYAVAPAGPGDTSTAIHPYQRIDGVFVDQRLVVRSCAAVSHAAAERASDHLPVVAVIGVPDRTDPIPPESEGS